MATDNFYQENIHKMKQNLLESEQKCSEIDKYVKKIKEKNHQLKKHYKKQNIESDQYIKFLEQAPKYKCQFCKDKYFMKEKHMDHHLYKKHFEYILPLLPDYIKKSPGLQKKTQKYLMDHYIPLKTVQKQEKFAQIEELAEPLEFDRIEENVQKEYQQVINKISLAAYEQNKQHRKFIEDKEFYFANFKKQYQRQCNNIALQEGDSLQKVGQLKRELNFTHTKVENLTEQLLGSEAPSAKNDEDSQITESEEEDSDYTETENDSEY